MSSAFSENNAFVGDHIVAITAPITDVQRDDLPLREVVADRQPEPDQADAAEREHHADQLAHAQPVGDHAADDEEEDDRRPDNCSSVIAAAACGV